MKIENKNSKKTVFSLLAILILSIVFIWTSIVLIYQVNSIQNFISQKVNFIGITVQLRKNAEKAVTQLSKNEKVDKTLVAECIELSAGVKDLQFINSVFKNVEVSNNDNLNFIKKTILQQQLLAAEEICDELIFESRTVVRKSSLELSTYWKVTLTILVIACLLMTILAVTALYIGKTKRKLLEEKSKNKFILNSSMNIIMSNDKHGNIGEFNRAAQQQFGYNIDEAKNLDYKVIYHSENDIQKVAESLDKEGVFVGEIVNKRKDGSLFVSFLSANRIYDQAGNFHGTMGISRDITQEKAKEQEFQNILNNAQDIIYTVNLEGRLTFANNSGSSIMGYSYTELVGSYFTDLVHAADSDRVRKFYANQFRKKIKDTYIEFKGVTKDKEVIWLGQNVTTLFSSTNSEEIIGFQGVVRDISKRKEAELKLKKSEDSFRIIVNTISDLFYLFDFRTERFEYISPNTEQVLGIPQEFFSSDKSFFTEYVHKNDVRITMDAEASLLKGDSYNIEYRVVSNGKTRWIHDRAFPIKDSNGKVISYSGVSRDITEVKSANLLIEQQNNEINQSISYAKNIQNCILLSTKEIYALYPDTFIFFNPRDVLSGDFYLIDKFRTTQLGILTTFVVADCTGHGVPGGMLSFLCNSLIRDAFADEQVNSPGEVLEFARRKLADLFRSSTDSHIYDGMDVSICAMSEDKRTLYFSGANSPITIVRNGIVSEVKADKQHVGYSKINIEFTTQIIDIQKDDMIFLYSDGYQDQFGGPFGKKYMKRRMKELLIKIHDKPLEEQYDLLNLDFQSWRADHEQVDDICVMGIRV